MCGSCVVVEVVAFASELLSDDVTNSVVVTDICGHGWMIMVISM